jgi:hypothetical protein
MSFGALRGELAASGLNVVAALARAELDARVPPSWRCDVVAPDATHAVVIGSGGRAFWECATASPEWRDGSPDPLDAYTRRTIVSALAHATGGRGVVALYSDRRGEAFLPMIALAEAAGLGAPGRIGLLIHPSYGPWVSLRAVAYLALEPPPGEGDTTAVHLAPGATAPGATAALRPAAGAGDTAAVHLIPGAAAPGATAALEPGPESPPAAAGRAGSAPGPGESRDTEMRSVYSPTHPTAGAHSSCEDCPAPCEQHCHGSAVGRAGLDLARCGAARATISACRLACDARAACIVGPDHRYSHEQLEYHARFSLGSVMRRVVNKGSGPSGTTQ